MFKKVFYNTAAQTAGKVITAASTLLITIIIGRSLGPAGYGDFTKIFVFVGYFYTFSDFGLNAVYVKNQNAQKDNIKYLFGLRLLIGLLFFVIAVLAAIMLPYDKVSGTGFSPEVKFGITIASITILTQSLFTTTNAYFQKKLRYDLSTIAAVSSSAVVLVFTLTSSFMHLPLYAYVTAYVFGGIALVASAYLLIENIFKTSLYPSFSKSVFLGFLKSSWPIGTALIFNLIYFRLDVIILSYTRTSQEVGVYGLAFQFFEASLTIPIFFANSLYPLLSNLFNIDRKEFAKQVKFWLLGLMITSFLFTLSLLAISFVIPLFFGSSFNGASRSLRILAIGTPFFYVSAILWFLLIIYDKQKYLSIIYAVGALFNLLANLVFVPKYGYIASSIITVVSEALITLFLVVALKLQRTKRY